jgi:23S rRNA (uracil1939-C5)-methyltransferase
MSEPEGRSPLLEIVRLGGEGDGVAEGLDGPIYIPRGLPGERYAVEPDASFRLVGEASAARRASPLCPHFPTCGGCTVQHMGEPLYRSWKAQLLTAAFTRAGLEITPEPMISVPHHSRRRATLAGRHEAGGFVFGYHAPQSHDIVPLSACAVLHASITAALPLLADLAARAAPRPDGEARLSVLLCREGLDVTISAGRRPANANLLAELARIAASGPIARITLNGEPAVQRAAPTVRFGAVDLAPPPAAFLQAVEAAQSAMAAVILAALPKRVKRIADLFAGLGTFTFALAARAPVEAFDSDRRLADALSTAARGARGVKPITATVRDLFLDPLSPRELARFDVVIFDPPRAGAKAQAEAIARSDVGRVVAVSCNPATLVRDVKFMVDAGWRLERIVPVDQFLYTPHLEVVAVLAR